MADLDPVRLAALLRRRATRHPLELPLAGRSMGRRWERVDQVMVVPGVRPSRGEVWMFVDPSGRTVTHRCRRSGEPARFRGDGNRADDAPVPSDRLVGRITAVQVGGTWSQLRAQDRLWATAARGITSAQRLRDGVRHRLHQVRDAPPVASRPLELVIDRTAPRRHRLAALLRPRDRDYLAEIDARWGPHVQGRIDPQLHLRMAAITGRRDPLLVPPRVWWDTLLPRLNDLAYREAFRDKNLSDQLLDWPPGPETYLRRVHGHYLDARYEPLPDAEVPARLLALRERGIDRVVVKPSRTDDGERIVVLALDARGMSLDGQRLSAVHLEALFGRDLLIQEHLEQHPVQAAPHPASVNTVRLRTLRWEGRIEVLPSMVRFGVDGARNDNIGTGGLACGVEADGRLRPYAVNRRGQVLTVHPTTGVAFGGREVPAWDEVVALGRRLHERVLPFDLVGWDIAVDPDGRPRLLEMNVRGDSTTVQLATGRPLFGALTPQVLDHLLGG